MNTCKTCKWWTCGPSRRNGICGKTPISLYNVPGGNDTTAAVHPLEAERVFTGLNYSCSRYEPKEAT